MSVDDWPVSDADFALEDFQVRLARRSGQSESSYTGRRQYRPVPLTARWRAMVTIPDQTWDARRKVMGFLERISRPNQVRLPMLYGLAPRGTMRGTPVVAASAAQGARSLVITTTGAASQTLLMGDYFGVTTANGSQVVTVTANATAAGNTLTVSIEAPLRGSVGAGTSVVWNAPPVVYVLTEDTQSRFAASNHALPLVLDLEEDW